MTVNENGYLTHRAAVCLTAPFSEAAGIGPTMLLTLRLLPIASSKSEGSYSSWANPNPAEVISLTLLTFGWVWALGSTTGKSFNSFLTLIVHHSCIHWLPNSVTEEIIGTLFIGLLCIVVRSGYTQQSIYWHFKNITFFQRQKTMLIQNMQL